MARRASSSGNLRSSGQASKRFSEVFSQGPTAIPAREDVDAAISSALAADGLTPRGRPLENQHSSGGQPSIPRSQPHTTDGTNRSTTSSPAQNSGGKKLVRPPGGIGDGGGDFGNNPGGGTGSSGGGGGGGGGGAVGGLLDWALWPVWGTIDALKWAGGTVNEVAVAPVIRMASPWGLAGSMLTAVKAFTPQRARDLARVAGNFGLNAAGLVNTPAGGEVLRSSGQAAGSLSMAVSSPAGRQFLLESATGLVKLAEALDTPEVKNFIQQGAVVAARGMDAMASRHTKIFMKDLADVMVRLVELANSREATTMAAEFTVNVEHALEMEHMAGIESRAAAKAAAAAAAADVDIGSIVGDARTASAVGGATGHSWGAQGTDGGVEDDTFSVDEPDGTSPASAAEAEGKENEEEHKTMDALVREARLERARQEGSSSRGCGGSVEELGIAGHRRTLSAASPMVLDVGNDSYASDDDRNRNRNRDRGEARASFDAPPIIRQADLKGDTPLTTFRRSDTAVAGGTVDVSPAALPSKGAATNGGSTTDTCRSAPSSPRGRHSCSTTATAAAGSALSVGDGSYSPVVTSRGRASTVTGLCCDVHTAECPSGHADAGARSRFTAGGGYGMGGESDGTESVFSSARPAVEYERDGKAKLPRFKSKHIASVLRSQPLGLELQLEAPNEDSVDDTVARASRFSVQDSSAPTPRVGASTGGGFSTLQDLEPDTTISSSGEEKDNSAPTGQSAVARASGSWKQLVFACLLLFFAGDGLRHRWKTMFRKPSSRSSPPSTAASFGQVSFGGATASGVRGNGGAGHEHVSGTALLPPTCQDPASGRTMAVWATPSGPCLSPALAADANTEGMAGGGGPGCSASFRFCSSTEVVVSDAGDVQHDDRRPEDGEL